MQLNYMRDSALEIKHDTEVAQRRLCEGRERRASESQFQFQSKFIRNNT